MLPPGMDIYADILARLPEYRAGKKGVVFRCPFGERHERGYDRTPSAGTRAGRRMTSSMLRQPRNIPGSQLAVPTHRICSSTIRYLL